MKRFSLMAFITIGSAIFFFFFGGQVFAMTATNDSKKTRTAGKSFTGTMHNIKPGKETKSSKGTASKTSIAFVVVEDKASVEELSLSIGEIKYQLTVPGMTKSGTRTDVKIEFNKTYPVKDDSFSTSNKKGEISINGKFVSQQEVQGSAHLYTSVTVDGTQYEIDLGEWEWKAISK